jgi:hypothetical protein
VPQPFLSGICNARVPLLTAATSAPPGFFTAPANYSITTEYTLHSTNVLYL